MIISLGLGGALSGFGIGPKHWAAAPGCPSGALAAFEPSLTAYVLSDVDHDALAGGLGIRRRVVLIDARA